jgi:xylulokinase
VLVPDPGEYVADGAARQAAWVLTGAQPEWRTSAAETFDAPAVPAVRARYAEARDRILNQVVAG